MKLLNITTSYILILIFTAISLWSVYFYYSIEKELYENVDEFLSNREFEIIKEIKTKPDILKHPSGFKTDFKIEPISTRQYNDLRKNFKDIEIFEPLEKENEPYRKLETKFSLYRQYYKLIITEELIDDEEMIDTVRNGVILLYIILLILLFIFNRILLQRLWRSFYITLDNLKKYRLDKDPHLVFDKTYVNEFNELNRTVSQLIQKNHEVFQNQKQFIENASHEMQTPLAIANGKIENLIQNPGLAPDTANIIQSINEDLERLTGLNKSLLLLSKIENDQFHEKGEVNIGELIEKIMNDFSDFADFKQIQIEIKKTETIIKSLNPYLAEILFRNLIKNAIYHNIPNGFIKITIAESEVTIENSGKEYYGNTELLFNRFVKNSDKKDSLGLGLSIVKTINNLYGYRVLYAVDRNIHKLTITFS